MHPHQAIPDDGCLDVHLHIFKFFTRYNYEFIFVNNEVFLFHVYDLTSQDLLLRVSISQSYFSSISSSRIICSSYWLRS